MNDSFLEDLELVPVEKKEATVNPAERYITTRRTNSPSITLSERDEFLMQHQHRQTKSLSSSAEPKTSSDRKYSEEISPSTRQHSKRKTKDSKEKHHLESRKPARDVKSSTPKLKNVDLKTHSRDEKLKPVENVDRTHTLTLSKEHKSRPTSSQESHRLSDGSSKENSRPSDLSTDTVNSSEPSKEWRRVTGDNAKKKFEFSEGSESLPMLNAIKDVVSGYTKMESAKIMRMMQDLYINSQASLIKQLIITTDDIKEIMQFNNESSRIEALVSENHRLMDNISYLQNRIEELQKIVSVVENIRKENTALKLRIQELEK